MHTERFHRLCARATDLLAVVAGIALLVVAATVAADVVSRWLFKAGIPARANLETYATAVALALGFPAVLLAGSAIEVDFLAERLQTGSPRAYRWLQGAVAAMVFGFFALAAWQLARYSAKLFESQEVVMMTAIPAWPFWAVVGLVIGLAACLAIVGLTRSGQARATVEAGAL